MIKMTITTEQNERDCCATVKGNVCGNSEVLTHEMAILFNALYEHDDELFIKAFELFMEMSKDDER